MAPSSWPSADDCLSLYNALLAVVEAPGVDPSLLKELLEENIDQLKKLLDIPPKNDASHAKIKSGSKAPHSPHVLKKKKKKKQQSANLS